MLFAATAMAQNNGDNNQPKAGETKEANVHPVVEVADNERIPEDSIYSCEMGNKAQFVGGEAAFREFVYDKFIYPKRCLESGISGSVIIRFVVEKDGRLSNLTVVEQSAKCPEFAAEALRVVRSSPKWIPGKANGEYVRSYRELPIRMAVN
jgi:TonB family protein